MWVGGVADSQTRSKPLNTPQITPEIALFDPNFTFCSPKSHKNPDLGEILKKNVFFYTFPYNGLLTMVAYNVLLTMFTCSPLTVTFLFMKAAWKIGNMLDFE